MISGMNRTSATPAGGWLVVAVCFVVAAFDGFDLVAPAVTAKQLSEAFGLSSTQLGTYFSAGTLGLLIGATLGGIMSDRFGRKPMLLATTLLIGVGSWATALAPNLEMLMFFRMITGIGLGATLPNVVTIASEAVPDAYRSRAVALIAAGATLGGAMSSLVALWDAVLADWRVLYFCGAAGPLLILPVIGVLRISGSAAHERGGKGALGQLFAPERFSATLILWTASILMLITLYVLSNWLPTLLVSRGLDHVQSVQVKLIYNLAGVAGGIGVGWVLDRPSIQRRAGIGIVFGLFPLGVLALATVPVDSMAIFLVGALTGMLVTGTSAILYALGPALYPPQFRGTGVGMMMAVGRIGAIIGPLMAGILLGAGLSATSLLLAMLPLVVVAGICAVAVATMADRNAALMAPNRV